MLIRDQFLINTVACDPQDSYQCAKSVK